MNFINEEEIKTKINEAVKKNFYSMYSDYWLKLDADIYFAIKSCKKISPVEHRYAMVNYKGEIQDIRISGGKKRYYKTPDYLQRCVENKNKQTDPHRKYKVQKLEIIPVEDNE